MGINLRLLLGDHHVYSVKIYGAICDTNYRSNDVPFFLIGFS